MLAVYKINQCVAAMMVYSIISSSEFVYEMTVHVSNCTGSKAVRIDLNLYTYLITKSCYT